MNLTDWERLQLDKADPIFKSVADRTPEVEIDKLPELGKRPADPALLKEYEARFAEAQRQHKEYQAFVKVLRHAKGQSTELLAEHARPNVAYSNLIDDEERPNHLRSLLKIKGKEYRVHELTAPDPLEKAGIPKLYELWIEADNSPDKQLCFICTDLPPELKPGGLFRHSVELEGYYFKLMEFTERNSEKGYAPLFLGQTLRVLDEEPVPPADLPEAERVLLPKDAEYWKNVKDDKAIAKFEDNPDTEYLAFTLDANGAEDTRVSTRGVRPTFAQGCCVRRHAERSPRLVLARLGAHQGYAEAAAKGAGDRAVEKHGPD